MPSLDSSRPYPDALMPPKGSRRSLFTMPLMKTWPASRSLLAGAAHLLLDVVEDLLRGERADLRRIVLRVADLESAHGLDEPLLELGRDLLVHDEPLGCDAALTGVLHARRHRDLHCLVQ